MANINFSKQGSNSFRPTAGLFANLPSSRNTVGQNLQNASDKFALLRKGATSIVQPVEKIEAPQTGPVKSHTDASGNKTEYHLPASESGTSSTGTNPGMISKPSTQTTQPQQGTSQYYANQVQQQSQVNNNPTYNALGQQSADLVKAQMAGSATPYSGADQSLGQSFADINRPQSTGNLAGNLANFNNQTSQALAGNAAQQQNILAGAQLGTQGASTNLSASLPQQYSYSSNVANPLTMQSFGAGGTGQYGTGPGAASNVQTIQDNTAKINSINSNLPATLAAFDILNSAAQGIGTDTPILSGLTQLYGSTAQGSQAVASFKAQLQSVRNQYDQIVGGGSQTAIPDNITPNQINQVKQQLQSAAQNQITNLQGVNNQLSNQGNSSGSSIGSTGGTTFGSFFGN